MGYKNEILVDVSETNTTQSVAQSKGMTHHIEQDMYTVITEKPSNKKKSDENITHEQITYYK